MNTKRGVTFLMAVVISALAISLGLGVSFILLEELKLATYNKNSFSAFFAADTGADCALYWDFKKNAFINPAGSIDPGDSNPPGPDHVDVDCAGQIPVLNVTENVFGPNNGTTTNFSLNLGNRCALVTVQKIGLRTVVTSLGHNIACGAASGPDTVERGIETTY